MSKTIVLPDFTPRWYQRDFMSATTGMGYKRVLLICHRRWGKDISCLNLAVWHALRKRIVVHYYLPTQKMCRQIIWNGIDNNGKRFLDYIPKELIKRKLEKEMHVELINGSMIQFLGTDLSENVGTNPYVAIFSEYALQNPRGWLYCQPILRANGGIAIFNSTPRGRANHMFKLYERMRFSDDWFIERQDVKYTGAISEVEIEGDIRNGVISKTLAMQEYYCDFKTENEGSLYGIYLEESERDGRVGKHGHIEGEKVYTGWDLGYDDMMCIWFFQVLVKDDGIEVRFIDYYENNHEVIGHYIDVLKAKADEYGYEYGGHLAPHDVSSHGRGGSTLQEEAEEGGLYFTKVPMTKRVLDDIEIGRRRFREFVFNTAKSEVSDAVEILSAYGMKKIERLSSEGRPVFSNSLDHCDTSDAFRTCYMALHHGYVRDYGLGRIGKRTIQYPDTYYTDELEHIGNNDPDKKPLWMDSYLDKCKRGENMDIVEGLVSEY